MIKIFKFLNRFYLNSTLNFVLTYNCVLSLIKITKLLLIFFYDCNCQMLITYSTLFSVNQL